jgi:hypothetical protein
MSRWRSELSHWGIVGLGGGALEPRRAQEGSKDPKKAKNPEALGYSTMVPGFAYKGVGT